MAMSMKIAALAALALSFGSPALALDIAYSTGTVTYGDLGGSSPGDSIALSGRTGNITGPGTYDLNDVRFSAGHFSFTNNLFDGIFSDTIASPGLGINSYDVAYHLVLGGTDTITLGGNSIDTNGYHIVVNPLELTSGVGVTSTGTLTATITRISAAPEPATWALMLGGVGIAGLALRRRKEQIGASLAA